MLQCRSRKGAAFFICQRGDMKTCSFFGNRDTAQTAELKQKITKTVKELIEKEGVDTFLFGSRSKFDELCHIVVTELKENYPYIHRIAYLCKHETACLVGAGMDLSKKIKKIIGREIDVQEYEEIKKCNKVNSARKAAYVERNQWMIDDSDFVIVRFDEMRMADKISGTALAYEYAKRKKCKVFKI